MIEFHSLEPLLLGPIQPNYNLLINCSQLLAGPPNDDDEECVSSAVNRRQMEMALALGEC